MKKHLTDKEKIEYKYLIELVSSSVNGTNPPVPYENINWLTIKSLARYCSLESLVANAVLFTGKNLIISTC